MIAALIVAISLLVTVQFFFSHCRSIIVAACKTKLSEEVRDVAGIEGETVTRDEFRPLLQLIQLCPPMNGDRIELRLVRFYYGVLGLLHAVSRLLLSPLGQWAERERVACSHFAAVVLDRRIATSRALLAQQRANF